MVAAFDDVIFNPDTAVGVVVGPVLTQFGYHLIVVDKRTGM
jgi:parvulin-like peptidyl-prolyl isomerase